MGTRWMGAILSGGVLLSLTACAESLHQTQRMTMLSQAQENGYAGMYDPTNPFYSILWAWIRTWVSIRLPLFLSWLFPRQIVFSSERTKFPSLASSECSVTNV